MRCRLLASSRRVIPSYSENSVIALHAQLRRLDAFSTLDQSSSLRRSCCTGCAATYCLASCDGRSRSKIPAYSFNGLRQNSKHSERLPSRISLSVCAFSTSSTVCKKTKKPEQSSSSDTATAAGDPLDLTPFQNEIKRINEQLSNDLAALKSSGLFDPMLIQGLRVPHGKVGKAEGVKGKEKSKQGREENVRLSDIAQVVPRGGRMVLVIVGDEKHAKSITSAILSSPYNLNPQPSPTNPLELHVPLPPPTAETRKQTLGMADRARDRAEEKHTVARADVQKKMRAAKVSGAVRDDDWHKIHKKMEDAAREGKEDARKRTEAARKRLQGG